MPRTQLHSPDHLYLRNFLLGFAHANSAPPHFELKDIELHSEYVTSQLDPNEVEAEMFEISGPDEEAFWYELGRLADQGYTLTPPDSDGIEKLKCFEFLENTI